KPSSLSREFRLFWSASGLLSVAGGKFTTYRHMAELITDELARRLGNQRPGRTRDFRLDGAPAISWSTFARTAHISLQASHGLSAEAARHLVQRYGRCAAEVAEYLKQDATFRQPVVPGEPDLRVEFAYQRE